MASDLSDELQRLLRQATNEKDSATLMKLVDRILFLADALGRKKKAAEPKADETIES